MAGSIRCATSFLPLALLAMITGCAPPAQDDSTDGTTAADANLGGAASKIPAGRYMAANYTAGYATGMLGIEIDRAATAPYVNAKFWGTQTGTWIDVLASMTSDDSGGSNIAFFDPKNTNRKIASAPFSLSSDGFVIQRAAHFIPMGFGDYGRGLLQDGNTRTDYTDWMIDVGEDGDLDLFNVGQSLGEVLAVWDANAALALTGNIDCDVRVAGSPTHISPCTLTTVAGQSHATFHIGDPATGADLRVSPPTFTVTSSVTTHDTEQVLTSIGAGGSCERTDYYDNFDVKTRADTTKVSVKIGGSTLHRSFVEHVVVNRVFLKNAPEDVNTCGGP
jgi:hypothetical protein